jgi:predicted PurR-regulated permease PerM
MGVMSELRAAPPLAVQRMKDKAKALKASETQSARSDDLTSIRRSLTIMAIATCGALLWVAQAILVPTAIAIVLALALTPIIVFLERLRIPTTIAAFIVVIAAAAGIAGAATALAPSALDWIKRAPEIAQSIERKLKPVKAWLVTYQEASSELDKITDVAAPSGAPPVAAAPDDGGFLWTAPTVLAQTSFAIVLALFLIVVRKVYRKRLILLAEDRADRLRVARILNESLDHVSEYLFTMMCVSIGLALVTAGCLAIAGVENALLWGAVFGVACFIPYLGPTAVILVCGVIQFATQDTIAAAAVAPLILVGINTIESNFVTPFLVSRRTEVSAIAIFLTIAVFLWLWGPAASIVAVPMLILFSSIAKNVPALRPFAVLLQAEGDNADEFTNPARFRFFSTPAEPATWRSRLAALRGKPPAAQG